MHNIQNYSREMQETRDRTERDMLSLKPFNWKCTHASQHPVVSATRKERPSYNQSKLRQPNNGWCKYCTKGTSTCMKKKQNKTTHSFAHIKHSQDMVLIGEERRSVHSHIIVQSWHHFGEVVKTIFLEHLFPNLRKEELI